MGKTELLAIMAAIVYSAESAGSRKADVSASVAKAGEILKQVEELVQAKKI